MRRRFKQLGKIAIDHFIRHIKSGTGCRNSFPCRATKISPRLWRIPVKKLKLNVEELAVTSFTAGTIEELEGTVHGASVPDLGSRDCGSWEYMRWVFRTMPQER